jgi:hypothetical protein
MYSHSLNDLKREYRKQKTYSIVLLILAVIPAISGFAYTMFTPELLDGASDHSIRDGIFTIIGGVFLTAFAFVLMWMHWHFNKQQKQTRLLLEQQINTQ